jgi:hypothetical protein
MLEEEAKALGWNEGETTIEEFENAHIYMQSLKIANSTKPSVVTMRQARLALLQSGLLSLVDTAIANGTDEAMKIEWEYATTVERNWSSLITLTAAMGMTSEQLDDLFLLASAL